ncbi:unnamed protein product [Macrosiphum euphorbiae]|uniref:Uncharacterized protein n=1 Tax=Macrosiphum euphorbiae TaxID=13131 RepID=A0AAV0X4Z6_9HEMI|nr:unnamed protein product [Macrosiphum euphorbiae]
MDGTRLPLDSRRGVAGIRLPVERRCTANGDGRSPANPLRADVRTRHVYSRRSAVAVTIGLLNRRPYTQFLSEVETRQGRTSSADPRGRDSKPRAHPATPKRCKTIDIMLLPNTS